MAVTARRSRQLLMADPADDVGVARLRAIADEATVIRDAALLLVTRTAELEPEEVAELTRVVVDGCRRLADHIGEEAL